jgi:hypothetical protein
MKLILGTLAVGLTVSLAFNFKLAFNNQTNNNGNYLNTEFNFFGQKNLVQKITIVTLNNGQVQFVGTALDPTTGNIYKFASQPTVISKFGKAVFDKGSFS